jgi:hypothetical protein
MGIVAKAESIEVSLGSTAVALPAFSECRCAASDAQKGCLRGILMSPFYKLKVFGRLRLQLAPRTIHV